MMIMPKTMKEATHTLLQRGTSTQTYDAKHPTPVRDLTNAYNTHIRAFQSDYKGGTVSKTQIVRTG